MFMNPWTSVPSGNLQTHPDWKDPSLLNESRRDMRPETERSLLTYQKTFGIKTGAPVGPEKPVCELPGGEHHFRQLNLSAVKCIHCGIVGTIKIHTAKVK